MKHNFTTESLQEFINIYSTPVLVINEKNYPILMNSSFKKMNTLDIQEQLNISLISNEYTIQYPKKIITYALSYSEIIIGNSKYKIVNFFDISIRKKLTEELKEKQNLFNSLTEQLPEGIVLFDDQIIYTNDTFEHLVGYSSRNLHKKRFFELIPFEDHDIFTDTIEKLRTSRTLTIENKLSLLRSDNSIITIKIKIKKLKQHDKNLFLAVITDISKELKHLDELSSLANYDKLTNLYNRRKFDELLSMEYKITKRYERDLSALFFDIDHFKKVNDTYGHDVGDIVLSSLSDLISKQIRETDIFARWGGEEFIILLPETTSDKAILIANEIMKSLSLYIFPKVGKVTISIGISSVKKERLQSFLKRLDNALYKAKEEGRNRYIIL